MATFTASDPEGAMPVVWSLTSVEEAEQTDSVELDDVADAGDFDISQSGVLTFKMSPSYEPQEERGLQSHRAGL